MNEEINPNETPKTKVDGRAVLRIYWIGLK